MAGRSPRTFPRQRSHLSPDIGRSCPVFLFYGGGGRGSVARSFGGGPRGASPSHSSCCGLLSDGDCPGCGTTSARTCRVRGGHPPTETRLRFCRDVRLPTRKFPDHHRTGILWKSGHSGLLGTVLSLGNVALYRSR